MALSIFALAAAAAGISNAALSYGCPNQLTTMNIGMVFEKNLVDQLGGPTEAKSKAQVHLIDFANSIYREQLNLELRVTEWQMMTTQKLNQEQYKDRAWLSGSYCPIPSPGSRRKMPSISIQDLLLKYVGPWAAKKNQHGGKKSMWMYMTTCVFPGNVLGVAPIGGTCKGQIASAVNSWAWNGNGSGLVNPLSQSMGVSRVFAHEMGHSLGSRHDPGQPKTLMFPSINTASDFSTTPSLHSICEHLKGVTQPAMNHGANSCFQVGSAASNGGSGNTVDPASEIQVTEPPQETANPDDACAVHIQNRRAHILKIHIPGCVKLIGFYEFTNVCVYDYSGGLSNQPNHYCRNFEFRSNGADYNEVLCFLPAYTQLDEQYNQVCHNSRRRLDTKLLESMDMTESTASQLLATGRMMLNQWLDY